MSERSMVFEAYPEGPVQTLVLVCIGAPPQAIVGKEVPMDEDKFNMSLRKFLKQVGVTSQREIERIVRQKGPQQSKLKVKIVLTAAGTNLNHVVEEEIDLG